MIQLSTQLAAALSWWDRGQVGFWYLLVSLGTKVLVVGIVSMQRLDDRRLVSNGYSVCVCSNICCAYSRLEAPARDTKTAHSFRGGFARFLHYVCSSCYNASKHMDVGTQMCRDPYLM